MCKQISKRTFRRRVGRAANEQLRQIVESMREIYPSNSFSSLWRVTSSSSSSSSDNSCDEETSLMAITPSTGSGEYTRTLLTEEEPGIQDSLRSWAIRSRTPLIHLTSLLKIIRRISSDLPSDARTLLDGASYSAKAVSSIRSCTMTRVTSFSGSNDSTCSRRGVSQIQETEKRWRSAILKGDVPEISRLLAESPELANWKDYITGTALHYAAKVNDVSLLRVLAGNYRADVESKNHGLTPLHVAAQAASVDFVELIMSQFNANPAARDYSGRLPVSYLPETPNGEKLKKNLQGQLGRLLTANPLLHFLAGKLVDVTAKVSTVATDGIHLTSTNRQLVKAQKEAMVQLKTESGGGGGGGMFCGLASCTSGISGGDDRRRSKTPMKRTTLPRPRAKSTLSSPSMKKTEKLHHNPSDSRARLAYSSSSQALEVNQDAGSNLGARQKSLNAYQQQKDPLDNDLTNQIYSSIRLRREQMSDRYNPMASRPSSIEEDTNTLDRNPSASFHRRMNRGSPDDPSNAEWATEMYASIRRNREHLNQGLLPNFPDAESPTSEQSMSPRPAVRTRVAVRPALPPNIRPRIKTLTMTETPDASEEHS